MDKKDLEKLLAIPPHAILVELTCPEKSRHVRKKLGPPPYRAAEILGEKVGLFKADIPPQGRDRNPVSVRIPINLVEVYVSAKKAA